MGDERDGIATARPATEARPLEELGRAGHDLLDAGPSVQDLLPPQDPPIGPTQKQDTMPHPVSARHLAPEGEHRRDATRAALAPAAIRQTPKRRQHEAHHHAKDRHGNQQVEDACATPL